MKLFFRSCKPALESTCNSEKIKLLFTTRVNEFSVVKRRYYSSWQRMAFSVGRKPTPPKAKYTFWLFWHEFRHCGRSPLGIRFLMPFSSSWFASSSLKLLLAAWQPAWRALSSSRFLKAFQDEFSSHPITHQTNQAFHKLQRMFK